MDGEGGGGCILSQFLGCMRCAVNLWSGVEAVPPSHHLTPPPSAPLFGTSLTLFASSWLSPPPSFHTTFTYLPNPPPALRFLTPNPLPPLPLSPHPPRLCPRSPQGPDRKTVERLLARMVQSGRAKRMHISIPGSYQSGEARMVGCMTG